LGSARAGIPIIRSEEWHPPAARAASARHDPTAVNIPSIAIHAAAAHTQGLEIARSSDGDISPVVGAT
jgi:hypothetical protein